MNVSETDDKREQLKQEFVDSFRECRESLQSGGPPVDHASILAWIECRLPDAQSETRIREAVGCYREWFDAYWRLRMATEEGSISELESGRQSELTCV